MRNDQAKMSITEVRALHGETHVNPHLQDFWQLRQMISQPSSSIIGAM